MATKKSVDSGNLNVFKECLEAWVLEQLEKYETIESASSKYESLLLSLNNLQESKQDKLTAGTGIEITSDNVVNVTIDNYPFIFVEELPTSDINENKIYCIPDEESTEEDNIWIEYYYANGRWEEFGKYTPKVDLSEYQKKLNYYSEGNQEVFIGGISDDSQSFARADVDIAVGSVMLQAGTSTSDNHQLKLDKEGSLTLDGNMVLTEDNVTAGNNVNISKTPENKLNISVDLDGYETTEAAEESHKELSESLDELKEQVEELTGDTVTWQTSDEYLVCLTDSEDNLLFAITKEGTVYIPKGLPDGIEGLKELLEEYVPTGNYLTREEADKIYQKILSYYVEGNQEVFIGGISDDNQSFARVEVDIANGSSMIQAGASTSDNHNLKLAKDGALTRDNNTVFDVETLQPGTNITITQTPEGYYNVAAPLEDYAKTSDIIDIEPYTDDEIRALFND